MSSYHSSFTYLNKNSSGEGFIIASFEPDSGFVDSYLGMDQITTDSYDGTKKYFYGNKYNTTATISITLVKPDGSDFSMDDNRRVLRWLTGSRQASWLDLYVNDRLVYSFYGNVTSCQQQKLDARIIGIQVEFSSIHPWAWSAPQSFNCYIGEEMLVIDDDGSVYKNDDKQVFMIDNNGVVFNDSIGEKTFNVTNSGVIYNDVHIDLPSIDNQSDDLYSYTLLDIVYKNETASFLTIKNVTLNEETIITGMSDNEIISISSGQFIVSDIPNKIFGDTFNFVWPRLRPGTNDISINGDGLGSVKFTYRYPIKIGDCAIDIDSLGINPICEGKVSGVVSSVDGITTLVRENILLIDTSTNTSYTIYVSDGRMMISNSTEPGKVRSFNLMHYNKDNSAIINKLVMQDGYLNVVKGVNGNVQDGRERIVFVDKSTGLLYQVTMQNNDNLYIANM